MRGGKACNDLAPAAHPAIRTIGQMETAAMRVEEADYAAGLCIPLHAHHTAHLIYVIAGTHWSGYSLGGDLCPPRTVRFIAADEPHENYFPAGSRCLQIELRRPIIELASEHGRVIEKPGEVSRPSAVALGARLVRKFRDRDDTSDLDLEAGVLRLLLAADDEPALRGSTPRWLFRVRDMLRDQEKPRPTLVELSACAGRHPVQVSRQFRHFFGCTISEYLRRVRIARAQALLVRRDLEIADIALVCGFSDQSHFTHAFRRLTGVSPRRYREGAGSSATTVQCETKP